VQGYDVVTSDDHKIGHVVDERDQCVIVEHGHVFKSRQAIPRTFTQVDEATQTVRATVTKDVFAQSPKFSDDNWQCNAVLRHYGVIGDFEVDADPNALNTDDRAVQERVAIQGGGEPAGGDVPGVSDRMASAVDPGGVAANQAISRPDLDRDWQKEDSGA
jgi:hypothetical protein